MSDMYTLNDLLNDLVQGGEAGLGLQAYSGTPLELTPLIPDRSISRCLTDETRGKIVKR